MAQLDALARTPETDWRPRNKFTGAEGRPAARHDLGGDRPLRSAAAVFSAVVHPARRRRDRAAHRLRQRRQPGARAIGDAWRRVRASARARRGTRPADSAGAGGRPRARGARLESLASPSRFWTTRALVAYVSAGQGTIVLDLWPDLRVLAFTAGVSALAGVLFATVPATARVARRSNLATAGSIWPASAAVGGRVGPGRALVVAADGALARAARRGRPVRAQPAESEPARHRRRSAQRPGRARRAARQRPTERPGHRRAARS